MTFRRFVLPNKDELARLRVSTTEGRTAVLYQELLQVADDVMEQTLPVYEGHSAINRRALSWYFGKIAALVLTGLLDENEDRLLRAKELISTLHQIADSSRTSLNTFAGRLSVEPLQESVLSPELLFTEHLLDQFGLLSQEDRLKIEQLYQWMFPFALLGFTEIQLLVDPTNNHVLLDASSAGLLAVRLQDRLPFWKQWVHFSNDQVCHYAKAAILSDGGQIESSPSYHTLVIQRLLLHTLLMRDLVGIDLTTNKDFTQKITAGVDWILTIITPDGGLPAINDSSRTFDASFLFTASALLTGNGKYTSALDTFLGQKNFRFERSTLPFGFLMAARNELPQPSGLPSENYRRAVLLPETGFALLRDEVGGYLICKSDPRLLCHTHDERCSFEWWPFGRAGALDPGMVDYQRLEHFTYFRLPQAHNTVARYRPHKETVRPQDYIFPDVEISHDAHPHYPGTIELVENGAGVRMWAKISEKVELRRTIRRGKNLGSLEITDELIGKDDCPYDWCFHGQGELTFSEQGFRFDAAELSIEGKVELPRQFELVKLAGPNKPYGEDVPYVVVRVKGAPNRLKILLKATVPGDCKP